MGVHVLGEQPGIHVPVGEPSVTSSARDRQGPTRSSDVGDRWLAAGCGLLALLVYVRTMYPGLAGVGSNSMDAPKFQFLGHVLGTAHNPGYPLYVVLTHIFGWLPIGRLAWRINLFSGVCAATAVALMYRVARRLSCGRPAAIAGSLGLAFGGVFWAQATIAEVYGLAVLIQAVILFALVTWAHTRRFRWLLLAMAATGLGLGHHLTIVTLGPALALFVILTDWRTAVRPRAPIATVLCVAAGLAQYGFILLRTHQGAAYLESRATSLTSLLRIVSGQSFAHSLFAFDLRTIVLGRLPLALGMLWREAGWLGGGLVLLGVWALWCTRRWAVAGLLLGGLAGSLFFVVNYDVVDLDVFLLPAIVLLWPLASVGIERVAQGVQAPRARHRVALALAATLPCAQFVRNLAQSDHHDHVLPIAFFDALFAKLPPSAAIVYENYSTEMEVQYMLLGEEQRRAHRITTLTPNQVDGFLSATPNEPLFAFRSATRLLASRGYVFSPIRLLGAPLTEYMASLSRQQTVALAVAGPSASDLGKLLWPHLTWQGVEAFVFVGHGGLPPNGALTVKPSAPLHTVAGGGYDLTLSAVQGRAELTHSGESLVVADDGAALAVLVGGRAREAEALFPSEDWRMPLERKRIGLSANRLVTRVTPVASRDSGWVTIAPAMPSSRVLVSLDPSRAIAGPVAELTLYVTGATLTTPRIACDSGATLRTEERVFAAGERELTAVARVDALPDSALGGARAVTRVHLALSDLTLHRDGYGCRVDVGGVAGEAWVRVSSKIGVGASLVPAGGIALSGDELFWLPLGSGEDAPYLGEGWREKSNTRRLLLPLARAADLEASFRMRGAGSVVLVWNGHVLATQPLAASWRSYSWRVPREAVRFGTNAVDLLPGDKSMEVSSLRLTPPSAP